MRLLVGAQRLKRDELAADERERLEVFGLAATSARGKANGRKKEKTLRLLTEERSHTLTGFHLWWQSCAFTDEHEQVGVSQDDAETEAGGETLVTATEDLLLPWRCREHSRMRRAISVCCCACA